MVRGTATPTDTEKFTFVTGRTFTLSNAVVTRVFFCGSSEAEMRAFGSALLAAALRFGSADCVDFCASGERVLFCCAFFDGSAVFALLVAASVAGFLVCSSADFGCAVDFSLPAAFSGALALSAPDVALSVSAALALSLSGWPVVFAAPVSS